MKKGKRREANSKLKFDQYQELLDCVLRVVVTSDSGSKNGPDEARPQY